MQASIHQRRYQNNPVESQSGLGTWGLELVVFQITTQKKRAAAIMSLIQSTRMNRHDPYAYLKDVLTRLPTQPASEITELLPHKWAPV